MTREQLEHLIRVAADIAQDDEIIVIGSQALLAQFPDAPASLRVSVEADLYPKNRPERADLIDGSEVVAHGMVEPATLDARLAETDLDDARRAVTAGRLARARQA